MLVCLCLTGRVRCAQPVVQSCTPDRCSAHAGAHACTAELEVLPRWSTVESFAPMRQPELVRRIALTQSPRALYPLIL